MKKEKNKYVFKHIGGFPGGSDGKESICYAGDPGLIAGLGRSPEERNGYPLQYSCLENSMDRGAWRATVWSHKESDPTEQQRRHIYGIYKNGTDEPISRAGIETQM